MAEETTPPPPPVPQSVPQSVARTPPIAIWSLVPGLSVHAIRASWHPRKRDQYFAS